jgi:geranylgeranyl pyrophosphate synthase
LIGYIIGKNYNIETYNKLVPIANSIVILFQIVDDIIDVTSSSDLLGKTANKDVHNNKATFVTILGLKAAQDHANNLAQDIINNLDGLPNNQYLKYMTEIIHKRNK